MSKTVRRVVTGHDASGKAVFIHDGPSPTTFDSPLRPNSSISELWVTDSAPAKINQPGEPTARPRRIEPPPHGTVFRVMTLPPDGDFLKTLDPEKARQAFAALGSGDAHVDDSASPAARRHPLMHRTETVDYGIVLKGEVCLMLDDSETVLRAGDVVIQRGTNHAWSNRSSEPAVMAFVLIDGVRD